MSTFWKPLPDLPTPSRAESLLEADATDLDLGTIWTSDSHKHQITVTNTSDGPLEVAKFETSCGCADAKLDHSGQHFPGESAELHLTLDLSGRNGSLREDFEVFIVPVFASGVGADADPWILKGKVRCPVVADPRHIALGAFDGFREQLPTEVSITLAESVTHVTASASTDRIVVGISEGSSPERRILTVTPACIESFGEIDCEVLLTATVDGTVVCDPVKLSVTGYAAPRVDAVPRRLELGVVTVGSPVARTITSFSREENPFTISRIESPPFDDAPVLSVTTSDSGEPVPEVLHDRNIVITPLESGHRRGSIAIRGVTSDGRPFVTTLVVEYYGTTSDINLPVAGQRAVLK